MESQSADRADGARRATRMLRLLLLLMRSDMGMKWSGRSAVITDMMRSKTDPLRSGAEDQGGGSMRREPNDRLDRYRKEHPFSGMSPAGASWGYFEIPTGAGRLRIVSSGGAHEDSQGWEHVSISLEHRCPRWEEMVRIKNLFWGEDECVIQFHPPESDYINHHPYVLHLWKPPYNLPLPPRAFV